MRKSLLKNFVPVASILSMLTWAPNAAARSKREGFNFGLSSAAIGGATLNLAQDDAASTIKTETSSVRPYIGYAPLEWLNLGVSANLESQSSEQLLKSTGQQSRQQQEAKLRGTSFYARFQFARILYFESGFGLYRKSLTIHNESSVTSSTGTFNGQAEDVSSSGVGPGYHVGAGMEFPVAYGFFFTSAFSSRIYQLRTDDGGVGLEGKRLGREQRRDLSFGLAYYYQD